MIKISGPDLTLPPTESQLQNIWIKAILPSIWSVSKYQEIPTPLQIFLRQSLKSLCSQFYFFIFPWKKTLKKMIKNSYYDIYVFTYILSLLNIIWHYECGFKS